MQEVKQPLSEPSRLPVMAIVNATPDSFSDGGRWSDPQALREQVQRWSARRVAWLDVGGESTRPGAAAVDAQEEWARVESAMSIIATCPEHAPISVDTRKSSVAEKAVQKGALMINDVSGLADPDMARVAAASGVELVIGHMRGVPETMQSEISFRNVVQEVGDELQDARDRAIQAGVAPEKIWVDPGIGFGKTTAQCLALLTAGAELESRLACRVMIGASRKRFLGELTQNPVDSRIHASLAAAILAWEHGASVLRVHDVLATCDAWLVWDGVQRHGAAKKTEPRA